MKNLMSTAIAIIGLAVPLFAQDLPAYVPSEGLVGWWPFNGNANDESGNGNDGVVNGATLTEDRDGNANAAFGFDGINDFILVPHNDMFDVGLNSFTWSIWCNTEPVGYDHLITKTSFTVNPYTSLGRYLRVSEGGWAEFNESSSEPEYQNNSLTSGELPGGWLHIVAIKNGGDNLKIYFNGVLNNTNDLVHSSVNYDNSSVYYFGVEHPVLSLPSGAQWLKGDLDDIAIYNRALTPEEITALYTGIPYVAPCADPTACNFEQEGECVFAEPNLDCAGNCLNDCNNNGVCDGDEVYGCEYPTACNYNPEANVGDGSCTFPDFGYDCAGNCLLDLNNNGLCDLEEVAGCTNIDAINYAADATLDDGSCMVTCKGDFDNDGQITINDLLGFLAAYGNQCAGAGCMDPAGCNYDPNATFDLGYCEYPAEFFNCDGTPINDADGDGIPDELEVAGCTDPEAGNYNPDATDDNGSCTFGLTGATHTCGAENVHNPELVYGSVTDIDGNAYRTIVIGNQEWMAENLNVEHYANGDAIPNIEDQWEWELATSGALCNYLPVPLYQCPYGLLYNWYATVDSRNLCPTGWHVPTDTEWSNLIDYLDPNADVLNNENNAGGQMKSAGSQYWASPNDATNTSGFSGLPGGVRYPAGLGFYDLGLWGAWWSSTGDIDANNNEYGLYRDINYLYGNISRNGADKSTGYSVRCIKD